MKAVIAWFAPALAYAIGSLELAWPGDARAWTLFVLKTIGAGLAGNAAKGANDWYGRHQTKKTFEPSSPKR